MTHYEERKYKGYTICIEFYGKTYTSKNARKYFVKDQNGKMLRSGHQCAFETFEDAKQVINLIRILENDF